MPIRVPQIQPSTEGGSLPGAAYLDPIRFGALSTYGTRALGGALGDVGKEAFKVAEADAILKNEEMKLDVARAGNEWQRQVALDVDKLEADPHGDPRHPTSTRVTEIQRRTTAAVGKSLKFPESTPRFEATADRLATVGEINARHDARTRRHGLVVAGTDTALQADTQDAVFGPTDASRADAKTRGLGRIQTMVDLGIIGGPAASARVARFNTDIERGEILRDVRDPVKRPVVIDTLVERRL